MKKYITILIGILLAVSFSCCSDDHQEKPADSGEELSIYISAQVPASGSGKTKAVSENLLNTMRVLVFEDTGSGYQLSYQVAGYNLTVVSSTKYNFLVRVVPTTNPVKLYLLGNVMVESGEINTGDSEATVKQALTRNFTSAGLDGTLPMTSEITFLNGFSTNETISTSLVRSVARADVTSSTAQFVLSDVRIYRANSLYQILPDNIANDVVTTASVPAGSSQTINTTVINAVGGVSTGQLYLPESALPATANRQNATIIVVGGRFLGDAVDTYYRLDFVPEAAPELFGQILRNHRYTFEITDALASGWSTPEEAAQYPSSQIEVEVKVWNEETIYMVFDQVYYFGVSTRDVSLLAPSGSVADVAVDTNVATYDLYWSDANGNKLDPDNSISLGESFDSPDDVYSASISGDGTVITVEANETGAQTPGYLLAEAGRLQVLISITQRIPPIINRPLNVFGSTTEIGSLGDGGIFGASTAGGRAQGMVAIMNNPANFGVSGTIVMQGINRAGRTGTDIYTTSTLNMFDVVYLTYALNPNATNTQNILNWREASDKRVLIVQFDNIGNTNSTILEQLGILSSMRLVSGGAQNVVPYILAPDAPEIITNGIFGAVDPAIQYRCPDDTYGVITYADAIANGITPILLAPSPGGNNDVVLGIDFNNRIIYSGDCDLYSNEVRSEAGEYPNGTNGDVNTGYVNPKRLLANMWAWIISVALTE